MPKIRKSLLGLFVGVLFNSPLTFADTSGYGLPDLGTAAASTLTIDREREYGDAFVRILRAQQPIVTDPLLNHYVNDLGSRLVGSANDVKTPFTFMLIQKNDINAFAFFGGHIALHTGLFRYAQTESELASVMAHEIAHQTQRHLARAMEDQARRTPLTIAATVGSVLLAIAAPEAGIAAAHATAAATVQSKINYTRDNEKEADRIGISILSRAGFDTRAMPTFFTRLADQYRYASTPPEFLLTHPLPDSRVSDTRARAQNYPTKSVSVSENYQLARARVIARYTESKAALDWFNRKLKVAPKSLKAPLQFGKALLSIDEGKFKEAKVLLLPLYQSEPANLFYLDAMTDLDLAQGQTSSAISRLRKALDVNPENGVLKLNLAYALNKAGQFEDAISLLQHYTHLAPDNIIAFTMLQEAFEKNGNRHGALAAQAETFALQARWDDAINNYSLASELVPLGSLDQARYDARIDQLRTKQLRFNQLRN
ncbi:hypothetical protein CS022_20985 [Veronia nyctiphanis]|uniref:Putative beta-barrel assembly-enhancing protease n=1 Tax=Veronia nyctiphanis TaxID=1278244 RepID=A0A4Q0YNC9_9GAMM|nr:M48 family metalloprotease [Veronia nyctiphanis]RXJ71454.1 hypothetical protein CS022_20985 [Veronia nyctiphanis]